jgi:hypothetical protein
MKDLRTPSYVYIPFFLSVWNEETPHFIRQISEQICQIFNHTNVLMIWQIEQIYNISFENSDIVRIRLNMTVII